MSLLITSNTKDNLNSGYNQQGINKSYAYQNNLNDTFKIPANSEIAVQSVKINRSGNIDFNETNTVYSFYFGEELGDNAKQREVLSVPWETSFALSEQGLFLGTGTDNVTVDPSNFQRFSGNVNNIARLMKASINRSLWHPNLMLNASSTINPGANVEALRNGSGVDWLGWKIQVTNTDSSKNDDTKVSENWKGANYNGTDTGNDYTYDPSSERLTAPAGTTGENGCVGIDYPLSLADGTFHITVEDNGKSPAKFGLCRALKDQAPDYFDLGSDFGEMFYDFLLEIDQNLTIRLFYAGTDGNDQLEMLEVDYGTTYNASTEELEEIIFNVKNERVSVTIVTGQSGTIVLTEGTSASATANFKPVSMTCRYLYPKVTMEAGKSILIDGYDGVDILNHTYYGFNEVNGEEKPTYTDWWAHSFLSSFGKMVGQAEAIDIDFQKNISKLNQVGLNGNNQCDYKVQFFFAPDVRYWNTGSCNTQLFMGFPNRSLVNVPNSTGGSSPFTLTYLSDEPPDLNSTQSLFVRLKNMTFNSVNLSKGANSKILYHIPAFSNTGARVGALFFEPNERVYLKLGNTEDLYLSTLEIDIVYADEKLAIDLVGKTTVVLHIQDHKH